jgi:hypothetical protein
MRFNPRLLENLSAYLDDALPGAERASVEKLLAKDASARRTLESLRAQRAALKDLTPVQPSEAFYRRVWRDIEKKPERRAFFFFSPLKTAAGLAAMGLVVVATHDFWKPAVLRRGPPAPAPSPIQMFQQPLEAKQSFRDEMAPLRKSAPTTYDAVAQEPDGARLKMEAAKDDAPVRAKVSALQGRAAKERRADAAASKKEAALNELEIQAPQAPAAAPAPAASFGGAAGAFSSAVPAAAEEKDARKIKAAPESGLAANRIPAVSGVDGLAIMASGGGDNGGAARFKTAVVRDADAWKALWAKIAPGAGAPELDFSRLTALVVFAGEKPTAGYSVRISPVRPSARGLKAYYRIEAPASGAFLAQVVTSPYQWVAVPRRDGPVEFIPQ